MVPRRLSAVILCLFMWIISLDAQDSLLYQRVTIPNSNCLVEDAVRIIEQHSGLSFSYNSGLFDERKEVFLSADQERLIDLLERLFDDASLNFSIIGKHLVIYRSVKTLAINPDSKTDTVFYFEIRGRVMDADERQPLPFSSIYLVGKSIGIISNEEGEFLLKLSSAELPETFSISCIGFKNFKAPVSSLINTNNTYYLETDVVSIQEVIIRKISPVNLLQTAKKSIRNNFPQEPVMLTSFYRETIQRGSRYTLVSEAILENFKTGYMALAPDQIKILKGRKSEDFSSTDTVMLKLKAGLNAMLLLDVVKNMPDFLAADHLDDYSYRMTDIVIEDGRDNYAVEFAPKPGSSASAIYSGRILIDIHDMAFKWVEFHVDPLQLVEATNLYIVRKPSNMVVRMLKANYKIAFRKSGNKYYLHMIQCETGFKIRHRKQFSGSVYSTKLEMAVSNIDTTNVNRFSQRETARANEFFADQVGTYDESFWGEYNFIAPDESLENAIAKLSRIQEGKREE